MLVISLPGPGAEVEPAQEFPGGGGLGRPGPEPVEPVVDGEMGGDDPVPDFLAGCRPAAGEVAHHLRVAVEIEQIAYVVCCEPAQGQSLCFQDAHVPIIPAA